MLETNKKQAIISSLVFSDEINQILVIQKECKLSFWTPDDYEQELKKDYSSIFIAKANKQVVGFLASRLLMERLPKGIGEKTAVVYSEAEILNIGVMENYRQKGIGSLLLSELLQNNRHLSIETVWLEVRASNFKAIKFYSNKGFIEIQRRKISIGHRPKTQFL